MKKELLDIINSPNRTLNTAIEYLKKVKEKNISSKEVYKELESLRRGLDDESEDYILEVMDIVSSWCSADKNIW